MEQLSNAINFIVHYLSGKIGQAGLAVTIDVWEFAQSGVVTKKVNAASATEIGDGLYGYTLSSSSVTAVGEYLGIFKTADTRVNQQHIPVCMIVGRAGIEFMDSSISAVNTLSTQIKAKTDIIPANPALTTTPMILAAAYDAAKTAATQASVNTIDGRLDTEIPAILAVIQKLDGMLELSGSLYRYTEEALAKGHGGITQAGVRQAIGMAEPNLDLQLATIQTKTDLLPDVNITAVNNIAVTGSGIPGTDAWRPV